MIISTVPAFAIGESELINKSQIELHNIEKSKGIETVSIKDTLEIEKESNERITVLNKEDNKTIKVSINRADEVETTEDGFKIKEVSNKGNVKLETKFPVNYKIEYARYPDGTEGNGSLVIMDQNGTIVASTGLPTVKDATGKELNASFIIVDNSIKVSVEDSEYIAPITTEYGVYASVAKAGVGSYFVYSAFNYTYKGSLTLGPRKFDEGSITKCTEAWNAVYKLFYPYSPYWTTATQTKSMKNQYWCHADFAKNKKQWNLEPKRPVVSWAKMVAAKCNP